MNALRQAAAAVAGTLVLGLGATGCGGSSVDDYCSALKADRKQFAAIGDASSPAAALDSLPMLHDLAKKAPQDIADDWHTFLAALDALQQALHQAGVKASDFQDGKPPAGLSATDRQAITEAADGLSQQDTVAAGQTIDQEARDVCKVNLGS